MVPAFRPGRCTIGNSSPFDPWIVISRTASNPWAAAGSWRRSRSSPSLMRRRIRSRRRVIGRPCPAGCTLRKFINCQMAMARIRSPRFAETPSRAAIRVRSSKTVARVVHGDAPWLKSRAAHQPATSVLPDPPSRRRVSHRRSSTKIVKAELPARRCSSTAAMSENVILNSGQVPTRTKPHRPAIGHKGQEREEILDLGSREEVAKEQYRHPEALKIMAETG